MVVTGTLIADVGRPPSAESEGVDHNVWAFQNQRKGELSGIYFHGVERVKRMFSTSLCCFSGSAII